MRETLSRKLLAAFICLCAMFGFNAANAQDNGEGAGKSSSGGDSKLAVGVKLGFNYSKLIVSQTETDGERAFGGAAGVFVSYNLNRWLAIAPEVMFSQTASNAMAWNVGSYSGWADYRLANIQANLLIDARLPLISVYKPRFYFGPSFDFNPYAQANVEGYYAGMTTKESIEVTNQFKGMDFGVIGGVGLDFDLKSMILKIDARNRVGFKDINNYRLDMNSSFNNRSIHTNNWTFLVGLGFKI